MLSAGLKVQFFNQKILSLCFIFLQPREHPDAIKQSRLNKKEIKKRLNDSFVYNESINKENLNAGANTVEDSQEPMNVIEEYEDVTIRNKKNIISFAYQQGKDF